MRLQLNRLVILTLALLFIIGFYLITSRSPLHTTASLSSEYTMPLTSHSSHTSLIIPPPPTDSISSHSLSLSIPSLIYSNHPFTKATVFTPSEDTLILQDIVLHPYTEGFIEQALYTSIDDTLSDMPSGNSSLPMYALHDYAVIDESVFVAFVGGLEGIYRIDLDSHAVTPLIFDYDLDLGKMYVSHMQQVGDTLVILGGKAHHFEALIYTVDLTTNEVLSSHALPTHPSALYEEHFTILSSGVCAFIDGNKVMTYDPFTGVSDYIIFDFEVTQLLAYERTALAFGESNNLLFLASLDGRLSRTLATPCPHYHLIDTCYDATTLWLAFSDKGNSYFSNYLCGYDLVTGEYTYLLCLDSLDEQMLVSFLD